MAEFICPECGKSVYWTPEGGWKGTLSSAGWNRTCDDCMELIENDERKAS